MKRIRNSDQPVCSRCDRPISQGETLFVLNLSLLHVSKNRSLSLMEQQHIAQYCFGCASRVLTDAAMTERLIQPSDFFGKAGKINYQN